MLTDKIPVGSDGFVRYVDHMGTDASVVQAARVSYGAGTKSVSDDASLIRYLMRHRHTTPFEMCELKLHVRVPMDCWRQWIRHRSACLAGDVKLQFNRPCDGRPNTLTVADVYKRFNSTDYRGKDIKERVQMMDLRCINEDTNQIVFTNVVDIWESGVKDVWEVTTESGSVVKMTMDHLIKTENGWLKLKDVGNSKVAVLGLGKGVGKTPIANIINSETEEWRPVMYWEDYYEVSSQGRVRRIVGGRGSRSFGRCKKITVCRGRAVVSLNKPGYQEVKHVHVMMLEAFTNRRPIGEECCHRDGNSLNNTIENLYWGTPQNNADDRVKHKATTKLACNYEDIVSVNYVGKEMTYDLEVQGPWHNFSADGLIVHNSVNEYSTRYSEAVNSMAKAGEWRLQSKVNKQGSGGVVSDEWPEGWRVDREWYVHTPLGSHVCYHSPTLLTMFQSPGQRAVQLDHYLYTATKGGTIDGPLPSDWMAGAQSHWRITDPDGMVETWLFDARPTVSEYLDQCESEVQEYITSHYQKLLSLGVAREQARKDLSLSTYTEAYWKIDLHNLLHFLSLRMDSHAQKEIREFANVIGGIVETLWPITWQAFKDYRLNAVTLTGPELAAIASNDPSKLGKTEYLELNSKLERLNEQGVDVIATSK